jgi:NAD(P)-dependent dehydrogenase (short-subunit alcohol dehydrogenase family)
MSPRIAIVTGATKGIGFEIARRLLAQGDTVIMTGRKRADAVKAAEALSAGAKGKAVPAALDVTDDESLADFVRWVGAEFRTVGLLVNNAGVAVDKWVSGLEVSMNAVRASLETNFVGPLALTQALVPLMRKAGGGTIVNVSTQLASLERMAGRTLAYRSSKVALNAMTRVLADELKASHIRINAVCPGWTKTDLGGDDAPRTPAEAADSVMFLCNTDKDGPTGQFFSDGAPLPW